MDIPVEFGAGVQERVGFGKEAGGEVGGEAGADEVVEGRCEEEFVDVEGEGGEGEEVGEGSGEGLEDGRGGEGEWVVHCFFLSFFFLF